MAAEFEMVYIVWMSSWYSQQGDTKSLAYTSQQVQHNTTVRQNECYVMSINLPPSVASESGKLAFGQSWWTLLGGLFWNFGQNYIIWEVFLIGRRYYLRNTNQLLEYTVHRLLFLLLWPASATWKTPGEFGLHELLKEYSCAAEKLPCIQCFTLCVKLLVFPSTMSLCNAQSQVSNALHVLVNDKKESIGCFLEAVTATSYLQFIRQNVSGCEASHSKGTKAEHAETAARY